MPSLCFLKQRNLANHLLIVLLFITHFLDLVFTRFRVFCRRAENDHINEQKEVLMVGKNFIFQ